MGVVWCAQELLGWRPFRGGYLHESRARENDTIGNWGAGRREREYEENLPVFVGDLHDDRHLVYCNVIDDRRTGWLFRKYRKN